MATKTSSSRQRALGFEQADLLMQQSAGILFSGDSGSGKSVALEGLLHQLIHARWGCTFIDPHGDTAESLERYVASMPPSVQRRVIVVRYADTQRVMGSNPLFVDRSVFTDEITRRAQISSRAGHVSKILLAATGERDFHSKPVLAKWTNRILTMLAELGLTIADARHFFDTTSPVYRALLNVAPDIVAQAEMAELAGLRPSDREDIIGSTKNRILNLLQNPVVELSLGKPNGHVDLRRAIQDRAIIIVNLARGGVLRDEDVEIFANLWLMEVLFAIYNTPRSQRVPHVIAIDELPVFRSSFELITNALPQVRKYLCRFAVAFQGTQLFEGRQEDRLLNALVSQCNAHFIFRHKNPVDAKFFGEVLKLPSFDTHKVKHVLTQLQQYQDGNEIVVLRDTSTSDSHAAQDGGSSSDAVSETTSTSQGTSSGASESTGRGVNQVEGAVHRALSTNDGRAEQWGSNESRSASNGSTSTTGKSWSKTKTTGRSVTHKQTLVPRIRTREVVSSVQFLSTDEQVVEAARDISRLRVGECFLYLGGVGVSKVRIPLPKNPLAGLPRYAAKKLAALQTSLLARPEYDTTDNLLRQRAQFEERLVGFLNDIVVERRTLAAPSEPVLAVPASCDNQLIQI